MAEKEWKRLDVVRRHASSHLTTAQAAEILGVSRRQMRRIAKRFEQFGKASVVHALTGRPPANRTPERVRDRVVALLRGKYAGFNDSHFTEKLRDVEGVHVARSTVQRLVRAAGIPAVRRRRPRRYRGRRDREASAGMMLLWDGSRHDWLEGRGPMLCLMGAIDDATGELMPGAHFVEQECAAGYLRVLAAVVAEKGIPQKLYMDQHGSLKRNDDHWSLEEELAGKQRPTQVGMALEELGIKPIFALSPQAKGRVERLWGTLQDRFVSELRLAQVSTALEATALLEHYRPEFNARFAKQPASSESVWRALRPGIDIAEACSFRYEATVGNDNVVSLGGIKIQIPRPTSGRSFAQARVQVHQLLTGSWRVRFRGELIAEAQTDATSELRPYRRRNRNRATRAFQQAVKTYAPPRVRAQTKPRKRHGLKRPFNVWTKAQKLRAARESKRLRSQRPASW